MSVTANIITDIRQDVVIIPNTAIKQRDDTNYVEVVISGTSQQRMIQLGLTDDTNTEVISGLTEGETIITQTVTAATTTTNNQRTNGTGVMIPGVTGGGNFQIGR